MHCWPGEYIGGGGSGSGGGGGGEGLGLGDVGEEGSGDGERVVTHLPFTKNEQLRAATVGQLVVGSFGSTVRPDFGPQQTN